MSSHDMVLLIVTAMVCSTILVTTAITARTVGRDNRTKDPSTAPHADLTVDESLSGRHGEEAPGRVSAGPGPSPIE